MHAYQHAFSTPQPDLDADANGDDLYERLIATVTVHPEKEEPDEVPEDHRERKVFMIKTAKESSPANPAGKGTLDATVLSQRWGIGLSKAKNTLKVMTQAGVPNVLIPSERKVRKKAPWLKFPNLKGRWFSDEMFSKEVSLNGDTGASVFTDGEGFDHVYPWKSKKQHPERLTSLIHNIGIPQTMVSDGARELFLGKSREISNECRIKMEKTVPYSPWQNTAEASIRELKKGVVKVMRVAGAPRRLWSLPMITWMIWPMKS